MTIGANSLHGEGTRRGNREKGGGGDRLKYKLDGEAQYLGPGLSW